MGETFTATITDATGLLGATGSGVSGSGTNSLTITGLTLSAMNAVLATLTDTGSAADTITINVSNQYAGAAPAATIAVSNIAAPTTTAVTALQANPFTTNIGVDTHLTQGPFPIYDAANVITAMNYLGINKIRDFRGGNFAPWSTVAAAGMQFIEELGTSWSCSTTACNTGGDCCITSAVFADIDALVTAFPGSVLAIQGPNEINNQNVLYTNSFTRHRIVGIDHQCERPE